MIHIVNNPHVYTSVFNKLKSPYHFAYPGVHGLGAGDSNWDEDLNMFMDWTSRPVLGSTPEFKSRWFRGTAVPFYLSFVQWRLGDIQQALWLMRHQRSFMAPDWAAAGMAWLERREARAKEKAS